MRPGSWVEAAKEASLSQQQSVSRTVDGFATTEARDAGGEIEEKERERRALLSCVSWPVSFGVLMFKHGVPVERGRPFFSFVPPCCVNSLEGREEAGPHFE